MNDLRKLIVEAASRQTPDTPPESITLDFASDSSSPAAEPDPSVSLEDYKQEYEIEALKQQLHEVTDTHKNRIAYIGRVFWLVVGWLACVVACVGLTGFAAWGFKLSDQVLIAFITSTTINVVGLFVVVAKWLYPSGNGIKKPTTKSSLARKRKDVRKDAGENE